MTLEDMALAVAVAIIWGLSFVLTKFGLVELSAAELAALRFAVAAVPCLFVPKPAISWPVLIAISFSLFVGQFLAQFYGIAHGVPPGLAAVIVQSQALFTVAFAALAFGEMPAKGQLIGMTIAAIGLGLISMTVGHDFSVAVFIVILISPISFAIGNLLLRKAHNARLFDLFAWLSLIAPVPLFFVAVVSEGPAAVVGHFRDMSWKGAAVALLLGAVATTLAYGIWGSLLRRYRAAQVVPFVLLVPVVGAASSAVVFGETFEPLRLGGMITVIVGIGVMIVLGLRTRATLRPSDRSARSASQEKLIGRS